MHYICLWCSRERIQVLGFEIMSQGIVKVSGLESPDLDEIVFEQNNT